MSMTLCARWSLFFPIFLLLIVFQSPAASAPGPGEIVRISVRTADGVHEFSEMPAIPEEAGGVSEKIFESPDGRTVMLELALDETGHVIASVSADPVGGVEKFGAVIRCDRGERFCGLLERVVDGGQGKSWHPGMKEALDLRGQTVDMFVKPTMSLYAPFFVASSGYGVHVEGSWPGTYDMAAAEDDEVRFEFEGPKLVFHILRGKPIEVVRKYCQLVGKPILPPRWAFSPWRWRDEHKRRDQFFDGTPYSSYFNAEVVEDVLMMDALGIPCGVYWVDRPWANGWRGYEDFEWDRIRLPHPEEMIEWLESRNIRFVLWIAPWVLNRIAFEGREKGYIIEPISKDERMALVDFTNPAAVEWWQGYLKKVIDVGVVGFKLDRAEEIVPYTLGVSTFSGMTAREMHNAYPRMYARAVHDVLSELRGDDFVVMPRAGYTGSQRYAVFWGGDTAGSEWGLRSAIIALQRAGTMGFAVWGADTGGYHQGFNRNTMARWLAFSAFCPLMEVGPTGNRGLWNVSWEPGYDVELIAMWSLYAQIHDRLGDYMYDSAKRANATGDPIVRPLFVQFPDDPNAPWWWDEYMLGEDILVCPIWRADATARKVYVPPGRWLDAWQPENVVKGPDLIEVECPLYKIPVYVRNGSDIDMGDLERTYRQAIERAEKKPSMAELIEKAGIQP